MVLGSLVKPVRPAPQAAPAMSDADSDYASGSGSEDEEVPRGGKRAAPPPQRNERPKRAAAARVRQLVAQVGMVVGCTKLGQACCGGLGVGWGGSFIGSPRASIEATGCRALTSS